MKHSTRMNVKPLQTDRSRGLTTTRQSTIITKQEKEEMRKKLFDKMKVSGKTVPHHINKSTFDLEISPIPTKSKTTKTAEITAAPFTPTQPSKHNLNFDGEILPPTDSPSRTDRKKSPIEMEYEEILRRHEEYRKVMSDNYRTYV